MLESVQNHNMPEREEDEDIQGYQKIYSSREMIQDNLMSFNRLYQTIKEDLKNDNTKNEWENFVANFNAIFEKLATENDELRMRLSSAQLSSRSNYPN